MNGDGANHVFKSYGLNVEGGYKKGTSRNDFRV